MFHKVTYINFRITTSDMVRKCTASLIVNMKSHSLEFFAHLNWYFSFNYARFRWITIL